MTRAEAWLDRCEWFLDCTRWPPEILELVRLTWPLALPIYMTLVIVTALVVYCVLVPTVESIEHMRRLFSKEPVVLRRVITEVCNVRTTANHYVPVHRPHPLGNPFAITEKRTRPRAILAYAEWMAKDETRVAAARRLRGSRLGCFCAPAPCHGDVIAFVAEGMPPIAAGEVVAVHRITLRDYSTGLRTLPGHLEDQWPG